MFYGRKNTAIIDIQFTIFEARAYNKFCVHEAAVPGVSYHTASANPFSTWVRTEWLGRSTLVGGGVTLAVRPGFC